MYTDTTRDDNLTKAAELCGRLKDLALSGESDLTMNGATRQFWP